MSREIAKLRLQHEPARYEERTTLKPSSSANGSRECAPDDRLRRMIQYPEMPVIEPIGRRRTGYSAGACRRARRRRDLVAGHDGWQMGSTRNPDRSIMFPSATQNLDLNCSNFQSSIHLKFN